MKLLDLAFGTFAEKHIRKMEKQVPSLVPTRKNASNCMKDYLASKKLENVSTDNELLLLSGISEGIWRCEAQMMATNGITFSDSSIGELLVRDFKYLLLCQFKDFIRSHDDFERYFQRSQRAVELNSNDDHFSDISDFATKWFLDLPQRTALSGLGQAYSILRGDA